MELECWDSGIFVVLKCTLFDLLLDINFIDIPFECRFKRRRRPTGDAVVLRTGLITNKFTVLRHIRTIFSGNGDNFYLCSYLLHFDHPYSHIYPLGFVGLYSKAVVDVASGTDEAVLRRWHRAAENWSDVEISECKTHTALDTQGIGQVAE